MIGQLNNLSNRVAIKIIAHRGYWINACEKNTSIAFTRALENGFGIETDFRDLGAGLVVSHDIPNTDAMRASEFMEVYCANPILSPIALNIKADGLHDLIGEFIRRTGFKNCFVFDMAVPDMRLYLKDNIPTFTRLSEFEQYPVLLNLCQGVWLDSFESDWYGVDVIAPLLIQKKQISIVSPELNGRPHMDLWRLIRDNNLHLSDLVSICTDFPMHARKYFYGE